VKNSPNLSPGARIIPSMIPVFPFVSAIKYLTSKVVRLLSEITTSSFSGVNLP
jgi:hypothetical protein